MRRSPLRRIGAGGGREGQVEEEDGVEEGDAGDAWDVGIGFGGGLQARTPTLHGER